MGQGFTQRSSGYHLSLGMMEPTECQGPLAKPEVWNFCCEKSNMPPAALTPTPPPAPLWSWLNPPGQPEQPEQTLLLNQIWVRSQADHKHMDSRALEPEVYVGGS